MREIWKDIEGYEGLYQVSNTGKVKSFVRCMKHRFEDSYILNPSVSNNGYKQVTLYRSPTDRHKFLIHRLVAKAFIPNPNNLEAVNHKDEDKLNNKADNLEWCTASYNNAYGTARIRYSITSGRKVMQYTIDGIHLATYNSVSIASMITGINPHVIKDSLFGKTIYGNGYKWVYEE